MINDTASHYAFTGTLIEIVTHTGAVIATVSVQYLRYYPYFQYLLNHQNIQDHDNDIFF